MGVLTSITAHKRPSQSAYGGVGPLCPWPCSHHPSSGFRAQVQPALPPAPCSCPQGAGWPWQLLSPLQAIFEILTSEFSYQHSLSILVAEFLHSRQLRATMTQTEHHHLFSNILDVLSASQR